MNNSEILEAAIKKVWPGAEMMWDGKVFDHLGGSVKFYFKSDKQQVMYEYSVYELLFSREVAFAKTFWGENDGIMAYGREPMERWEYHLSRMVLEEDPIQYLKQFLNE